MKSLHFFNLVKKFVGSLGLLVFLASSASAASPLKVHVLNNLDPKETREALKALSRLGYQPTLSPLFSESPHAVVITKTLGPALETASLSFEILELKQTDALPKTLFEIKESPSLETLMNLAPKSDQVRKLEPETIKPVATLN